MSAMTPSSAKATPPESSDISSPLPPQYECKGPSSSPSVIVDRVCAEALLRGADVFKPGIICAHGDIRMGTKLQVWGDVTGNFEVLDMCCAPGGKTNHLSCLLRSLSHLSPGSLTCIDRSLRKMRSVRSMLDLAGFHDVTTLAGDSQGLLGKVPPLEVPKFQPGVVNKAKAFPRGTFTHILLDPPCSAMGLRPRLCLPDSGSV
ncbi:hypothetical protein TrRE_jg8153, partial [Triparma retinervis]